jgi:hypothetical protein
MIDHLTRGRCFVRFSRGYQARWTNVLGQHLGSRATLSPQGKTAAEREAMGAEMLARRTREDELNREIFEEQIELVRGLRALPRFVAREKLGVLVRAARKVRDEL